MAPEQLGGKPATPAADIYAWGLLFLECLTGQAVISGASLLHICATQLSATPIPIPEGVARTPLGPILARATAKPLSVRYRDVEQVLNALDALDPRALDANAAPAPASPASDVARDGWLSRLLRFSR